MLVRAVAVDKNLGRLRVSNELGQIGADQVTALVQLSSIPLRAAASKVEHPFTHVATAPVLSDEFGHVVAPLTRAKRALNPQDVQLAGDITEGDIGSGHALVQRPAARLFADELLGGAIKGARRTAGGIQGAYRRSDNDTGILAVHGLRITGARASRGYLRRYQWSRSQRDWLDQPWGYYLRRNRLCQPYPVQCPSS
jgi:hypothetical protein